MVESEVKYGYYIDTFEAPRRGTIKLVERDCGDHIESTYLKGVLFNKPEYVAAAGGNNLAIVSPFQSFNVSFVSLSLSLMVILSRRNPMIMVSMSHFQASQKPSSRSY